jgi:hypothetical protein
MYAATYRKLRFEADTLANLQAVWLGHVGAVDLTSSEMGANPRVYRDGKPIGWLSYNGRAWPVKSRDWTPQTQPLTA